MKGKDKCEFLKGIRKRMAEANGIAYEPRECTYEGECTGTCPFCEKEAAELMAALKKKEDEGAEIKTDDVGILAIELGINKCEGTDEGEKENMVLTGAEGTLIEQGKNMVEEQQLGNLMNSYDEDTNIPELPIDPFRSSNNPLMSRKELSEIERIIREQEKPLMGDVRFTYSELNEDDKGTKALLQEEEERAERERKRGIISKILANIKRTSLQGLIEED
jgi:hypothetical protein